MSIYEDPLQFCSVEKWSELEDISKADWPRSISVNTLLEMQRYILHCELDHGCKVYCPYGDGRNGIVAINIKKGLYEVIVQCPSDDTSKLEDALRTTNIIDWNKEMEIPFVPKHVMNCIKRVIDSKKVQILQLIPTITFILDVSTPLFNVNLPPGFSFEPLSLEHIDLLDSTWPHRYEGCNFYFELIIKAELGYGLFKDKRLVSWALVRETGALLHLYTLEEERRKGCGELVLKLISNVLLKDGKHVVAFCKKTNVKAANLYKRLNFQFTSEIDWCTLAGTV